MPHRVLRRHGGEVGGATEVIRSPSPFMMESHTMRASAPLIAAIYARKSTDQHVAEAAKSVTRQVENARAYAQKKGWAVADAHVYVDDGISGAEFARRPGLAQLRKLLKHRAPFQVLIVSEQKSLGREVVETSWVIKELDEAGCEVWSYSEDKCLTPRSSLDKMMSNVQGFADENHREKSSQRVIEAHERLHRAGHVVGGRIFGYKNRDVFEGVDAHGRPLRSHVERVIDTTEADAVRRIFEMYDSGLGLKRIASILTAEGAPAPKPFKKRVNDLPASPFDGSTLAPYQGWAKSTVRSVLTRELYRGVAVWGKTKKKNHWGKLAPHRRPASDWHLTEVPHLRIIDDALWRRVHARRGETESKAVRFASGRMSGRPPKHAVQNLLAGLATCGVCGGGLVVEQSNNRKGRYAYYICHRRRHHGSACTNTLRISVAEMNEAVLQAVEAHALTPEAIEQVVQLTERDEVRERQTALQRECKDLDKRIARLVAAVETAGDITLLADKLRELEARRKSIDAELRGFGPLPRLAPHVLADRLAEWRRLLRASTTQGRAVLQRVLRGRITFTPCSATGYTFEAPTRFDKLFAGIVVERPTFIPHTSNGTEHIGVEDTFDGDYGRLLERAVITGKGWCALHDSNVRPPGS
jgi:DNA invertase Pin-like site-specific DNA recombinase